MNLLIIEDDAELRSGLQTLLTQRGYRVEACAGARDGLAALLTQEHDLAIIDLALPDGDGLALIRAARAERRGVPVLVVTARDGVEDRVAGLDAG
ncbi:MAG TPA: response regulator, partial [Steroidobacteraceae bacterium]|nr:response regulator [Steroidobacteraceae bacterium]